MRTSISPLTSLVSESVKTKQYLTWKAVSIFFLFVSGVAVLFGGQVTFAQQEFRSQSCSACTATPSSMQHVIDMVTDIGDVIRTQAVVGPNVGGFVPANIWDMPDFRYYNNNLPTVGMRNLVQNINQKAQTVYTTTAILGTMTTQAIAKDGPLQLAVLAQNEAILRDRQKLQALDLMIADEVYYLGVAGSYFTKLAPSDRAEIQQILNRYVGEDRLFNNPVVITSDRQYRHIMVFLQKIVSKHKSVLALGQASTPFGQENLREWSKAGIKVVFGQQYDEVLHESYQCVRGITNECPGAFANFMDDMQRIRESSRARTKEAINDMIQAVQFLRFSLRNTFPTAQEDGEVQRTQQEQAFLEKEQRLASSIYGLKNRAEGDSALRVNLNGRRRSRRQVANDAQQKEAKNTPDAQSLAGDVSTARPLTFEAIKSNPHDRLGSVIQAVFEQYEQARQESLLMDSRDVTFAIAKVSENMRASSFLIADKASRDSLKQLLLTTCNNQCSNLGKCQ